VGHEWLLSHGGEPAFTHYESPLRPPVPPLDQVAPNQPSAACGLRPLPEAVRAGRDFARTVLLDWGLTDLVDVTGLVVSELLTNALRHGVTGGRRHDDCPIRLRLLGQAPYVMCMVADPGDGVPVQREYDACAENGRGLSVVQACSVRWGWHLVDGGGKVVWALLHPGS
jgi:anti-sigma regulatory factor (Ser/Thr protein kinase)